jgi:Phage terminase large subunit (GpA)
MGAAETLPLPDEEFEEEERRAERAEILTDEELWFPESEEFLDFMNTEFEDVRYASIPSILPSQFTEFAFRMPRDDGFGYEPFTFKGRRHMIRPYNTPAKRMLLFCARQVEKSTLLGNRAITYSCLLSGFRTLYVSPSATQTKTFSSDRIKDPLETSEVLRSFTQRSLQQNVFEKQFINRSKITLRYAFLNADRTRGIPATSLLLDELQDILADNIPIIEQCTSHAPEQLKRFVYAGTPKSTDNVIEYYRANKSTQGEWVVPCDAHGGEGGRYWNVLGEKNIGKKGLICEKCGAIINPMHDDAQWAFMTEFHPIKAPFESYRIPQLMVPWKPWDEVLLDYDRYSRDKFYNEVLGISFDSGLRPLTPAQVRDCCSEEVTMNQNALVQYRNVAHGQPIFAGLDWGTGEHTYTVLSLGTYMHSKFRIFYVHRFAGEETDPEIQLQKIVQMLRYFNVAVIGADYGGGHYPNDKLTRTFGHERVQRFQYVARPKKKVLWNVGLRRWMVHRTDVMSDIFNAIKRKQIQFPRWEEFQQPFAQDMLNIFSEYNNSQRMIQYNHHPDKPDDTFHSVLYCFLASMIKFPRPDIIAPTREDPTRGPLVSSYTGPTNQG